MIQLFALAPERPTSGSFPWAGLLLFGLLIWGGVSLGIKGFSDEGIPFTKDKQITGPAAKLIGVVCFALGLMGLVWVLLMIRGSLM